MINLVRTLKGSVSALLPVLMCLGVNNHASAQTGNVVQGGVLYATHCAECHSIKEGKNKKGPSLFAIIGKPSGQREGFSYSDGIKAKPVVWNTETLSTYLANPKKAVPGGKMKFDGLENSSEIADVIAYLGTLVK